jgi:hypothetical protein
VNSLRIAGIEQWYVWGPVCSKVDEVDDLTRLEIAQAERSEPMKPDYEMED